MRGGPVIDHPCGFYGIVRYGCGVDHSGRRAPEGREDLRGDGYLRQPARFARVCFVGRPLRTVILLSYYPMGFVFTRAICESDTGK